MVLEVAKDLVSMGRKAARSLPKAAVPSGHVQDHDLYILMHGFAGAFTAVLNTIKDVECQGNPDLSAAFQAWKANEGQSYDKIANKLRNLLVHRGKSYTTLSHVEFVEDDFHDTWFPERKHVLANWTAPDGTEGTLDLAEWADGLFYWWERQLMEIERLYNRRLRQRVGY